MYQVLTPLCLPSQLTWDTSSQIREKPCCLHFAIACHERNLCMIVAITAARQRGTMQSITRKPVPKLQNGGQDSFGRRFDLRETKCNLETFCKSARHVAKNLCAARSKRTAQNTIACCKQSETMQEQRCNSGDTAVSLKRTSIASVEVEETATFL